MVNIKSQILALAFVALPLAAADINGTWKFYGNVGGKSLGMDCTIKQNGQEFSAACKPDEGGERNFEGMIEGETIQFSYRIDQRGTMYPIVYTGTVKNNSEIMGDIHVARTREHFYAKKQPA